MRNGLLKLILAVMIGVGTSYAGISISSAQGTMTGTGGGGMTGTGGGTMMF